MAAFETYCGLGMRSAIGREMFERPAVDDERLFDSGLVKRRVHRLTKSRVAEPAARPVHANRRPVDHDADGLGAANEQPGFRRTCSGSQTYPLYRLGPPLGFGIWGGIRGGVGIS